MKPSLILSTPRDAVDGTLAVSALPGRAQYALEATLKGRFNETVKTRKRRS